MTDKHRETNPDFAAFVNMYDNDSPDTNTVCENDIDSDADSDDGWIEVAGIDSNAGSEDGWVERHR